MTNEKGAGADPWRKYIRAEKGAYGQYFKNLPEDHYHARFSRRPVMWLRRLAKLQDWYVSKGVELPGAFLQPYAMDVAARMAAGLPIKYQLRGNNIAMDFARLSQTCPDLTRASDTPYSLLNLSSGGCGAHEVARHFGHSSTCADYFDADDKNRQSGWSFGPIHEELGITAEPFDGKLMPYGFETNSFDFVTCFQAVNFYGDWSMWHKAVDEMCRIACKKVVVVFNPPKAEDDEARDRDLHAGIERVTERMDEIGLAYDLDMCPAVNMPLLQIETSVAYEGATAQEMRKRA